MFKSSFPFNPDLIQDITKFHEKFNLTPRSLDDFVDRDLMRFRVRFMAEELKEINQAAARGDIVEVLDGLVDLVYVAIGTAYMLNLPFAEAWDNVQRANMAKEPVSKENPGKRGHSTDIVKPPGWTAPDHKPLLSEVELCHPPLSDEDCGLVDLSAYFHQ